MEGKIDFIILDDNVIDILTHKIILRERFDDPIIFGFSSAPRAMEHIKNNYPCTVPFKTILLLDLNMPITNGWAFLEEFTKLDAAIKDQISIVVVSFGINRENEKRAALNPEIELIISKPLTDEKITRILNIFSEN